jgi:hypothetical protein
LLQQEISHQLIFGCISLCLDDSWSIVIENFSLIIESISKSTSSHVHSAILRLIGDLARRSPEGVAVHSTALFTSLSGPTLFSDDTANLTKLKQLLSVILPALGEKVEDLLDYFSENLANFSVDRACQLMVHSVHVLSENSFRVFTSLLRHNCEDFSLLLVDQLPPNELLGTMLNLVRHDKTFSEFVFRIQLPPIPDQLFELFSILAGLDGFNQFFEQTCDSFLISDFVQLMNVLIPTNIEITELIRKRISVEPSSQFGLLIPTLLKQLQLSQFLSSTMSILSEITLVLTMSNDILEIVKAIMNGIDNDRYTILNKVQALCLMSSIIEKFNIKMLPIFQRVINFAAELYSFLVNENIAMCIPSSTAAVCLLLSTSPNFCIDKLPQLWTSLLSPTVYQGDLVSLVETSFMTLTNSVELDPLIKAFLLTYQAHSKNYDSLLLLFSAFENCLKPDAEFAISCHKRILKFLLIAFNTRCKTWKQTETVISKVIKAFCVFMSQLTADLLCADLGTFNDMFHQLIQVDETSRIFYVRTLKEIAEGSQKMLNKYYYVWLPLVVDFLNTTNDKSRFDRILACCSLELIQVMARFAEEDFFDRDRFASVLPVLVRHSIVGGETTESFVEKVIRCVAPAFAAVMDATKDETLWRMADLKLIELMGNEDYRVRIAALKLVDEAFRVVGSELTTILPELAPWLLELSEDPHRSVDVIARETLASIQTSVGEDIDPYFR